MHQACTHLAILQVTKAALKPQSSQPELLQVHPGVLAMAAVDWSSLPCDLVRRVADCFLAANDVDCYMDLRAVCGSWRSATDDPKDGPDDPRFRPRQWVVLDDDVFRREDTRLLVNTHTGRFLRKGLPLLGGYRYRYRHVATALGGFFVLADYDDYNAARVLNPFTGHMIHFMAKAPSDMVDAAAVIGSPPTLILLCDSDHALYMADPGSTSFALYQDEHAYQLIRLAVAGGMYADGEQRPVPPLPATVADKIFDLMRLFSVDPSEMFCRDVIERVADDAPEIGHANNSRCFLVQSLGEVLVVFKLRHRMEVFRMDSDRGVLEPVKSIGRRAIFVDCYRCLAVDADKFPSVEANCIYHLIGMNPHGDDVYFFDVYKYDLKDGTEEMVSEAISWSDPLVRWDADPPFTAVQLLSSYNIEVWDSELVTQEICRVDVDQLVEEEFPI
ncbi:hypothetical protein CFC21_056542 [Triticum aestivum]|uniref:KIB1-4 beta-propeller domain-containing protein n=3 Tax=Triticum TaxID=4564 RepID=A0A9R0SVB2_TRITD|nr:hypothetical protein CFC21_056542 [Triticum aestivum]VAI01988.1 unnamed protein product [Triticum turgidum subsp. durum]